MKSTRRVASLAAVSAVWLAAACSSSSSDNATDGGSSAGNGGSSGGGAGGGAAGSAGGGTGGSGGAGTAGTSGGGTGGSGGGGTGGSAGSTNEGGVDGGGNQEAGDASMDTTTVICEADADLLHDPENCGRCDKSCAGGDCDEGVCVPVLVLDTQEEPYGIHSYERLGFVDQAKVYLWEKTTRNANHYKLLSTSSTPASPAATGEPPLQDTAFPPDIGAVAFDATNLYEAILPDTTGNKAQVSIKTLADASAPTKMFTLPAGPPDPNHSDGPSDLKWDNIAVGSNAIYLSGTTQINGFSNPNPDTTAIYRIATPVADPANEAAPIVTGLGEVVTDLAVFGNATAGEHLFWLDYMATRPDNDAGFGTDYFVLTAPAAGGTPVLLDDANTSDSAFASDGTYVYWTQHNDAGKLMRCPLANLDPAHVEPVADASNAEEGIVAQGQYVYLMEFTDPGPIYRVNTSTGVRDLLGNRAIGASEKESYVFGADANFLYMAGIDGKVYRLPSVP